MLTYTTDANKTVHGDELTIRKSHNEIRHLFKFSNCNSSRWFSSNFATTASQIVLRFVVVASTIRHATKFAQQTSKCQIIHCKNVSSELDVCLCVCEAGARLCSFACLRLYVCVCVSVAEIYDSNSCFMTFSVLFVRVYEYFHRHTRTSHTPSAVTYNDHKFLQRHSNRCAFFCNLVRFVRGYQKER